MYLAPPIAAHTADNRYAVLLNAPEEIPPLTKQPQGLDTDRLLDDLSAAALELEQASNVLHHHSLYGALPRF